MVAWYGGSAEAKHRKRPDGAFPGLPSGLTPGKGATSAQGYKRHYHTHTASRRGLLGRSGAALLAGAAAATVARAAPLAAPVAAGDDAELIRLHQSFLAEEEIIHAWNANTVTWAVGEAASNRWWAALRAMQDIPALTAEGVRIKADCSLRAFALGAAGDSGPAEDFAIAFLAQLSGRAAA